MHMHMDMDMDLNLSRVAYIPGAATLLPGLTGMMVTARVADSGLSGTVP